MRVLLAFLAAWLLTYGLCAVATTQTVLAGLAAIGHPVSLTQRLQMTVADLLGLAPVFGSAIAVALLLGFLLAYGASRLIGGLQRLAFLVAGAVAVAALHLVLEQIFNVPLIIATRNATGLLLQSLAGAAGGYLFARIVSSERPAPAPPVSAGTAA